MGYNLRQWIYTSAIGLMLVGGFSAPVQAGFLSDAGLGVAAIGATVVYAPTKLVYAALGGITGGFTYVLTGGNYQTAERVWSPALGGDYLLNTGHLRGQEPIFFSGPTP